MNSEARRLQSLQLALDQHESRCGDQVRAILLNPFERDRLDWDEFRGIPIEPAPELPTGVVKIDCLRTTIRQGYEDFKRFARDDDALAEAEVRLEAKLEQLAAALERWWATSHSQQWWNNAAYREPEITQRAIRGHKLDRYEKLRLEIAQLPDPRDRDLTDLFERWDQAHADMGINVTELERDLVKSLEDIPILTPKTLSFGAKSPERRRKVGLIMRLRWFLTSFSRYRKRRRLRRDLHAIGRKLS